MLVSCGSFLARAVSTAAVLWLCGSAASAAGSLPDSCDDIETAAAAETRERFYASKRHRELMAAFEQNGELGAKDVKALRRIREDGAKREGRKTAAYAILTLDLARIGEESEAEADAAFDLLRSTARSKEEIETLLQRAANNIEGDSLQAALEAAEKHRAIFGAAFRQVEAISRSHFDDIPADVLASAGTRIVETGRQLKSARAIYRGNHMRLAGLNRSASPDAAALAAELLPEAAARLEKSVASVMAADGWVERVQQCWTEQPAIREIATALPPSAELARLSMLNTMLFHQDGLHGPEFWYPFVELAADKDQNADAFREAMKLGSRAGGAQEEDEASFAITAANAMAETSYPALARTFFEAALAWSDEAAREDPETRLEALLGYAEFEWNAGNSGRVEPLARQIDELVDGRSGEVSADFKGAVHAFKARLADARLLDGEVVAEVERAIAEAVAEDELLPENDPDEAQGGVEMSAEERDEVGASKYAVDAILQEHLEGQFCLPCGAGLREPLKQWWTLLLKSHNADEWNTGSEYFELGLATLLSESAAVDDELRRTASDALRDALLSDTQLAGQRKQALRELTSSGETEERALLLVSLSAALGTRADGMEAGDVLEFITTDDDETRAASAFMLAEARIDFEKEFTGVAMSFEELDRSIRLLGMAGLDEAAALLTYEVIRLAESAYDKDGEPDENGEPLFSGEQRLQVARVLGAAYARQARRDFVLGLWKEADASAGKAIDLMAARLRQDWRVGNERAILLYRAFQPALKLAAQIRFLLAANETSSRELPEITERVFSDLQFAMMGETAFASQAAVQKRILEDHGAAQALKARDDAVAALEHIEAVQAAIESSDEQLYESRRDRARGAAAKAEDTLRVLLPGAETVSGLVPRSVDAARSQLQPNEALLVLHSGSSNLYGFALRQSGDPFLFLSKSGADLLTEKIGRLRRDAAGYGGIDIANSEDLYSRLLGPAETYLEGIDHLLVVADGQLLALPWAALSTGHGGGLLLAGTDEATRGAKATRPAVSAKTEELAGVQWLIRKYPVSVVPGVSALTRETGAPAGLAPFLGIGNPVLDGSIPGQQLEVGALRGTGGGIDASQLAKLEPLPETADELAALATALGGSDRNLLLGADATEDRLRTTPVGGFQVLSFATHGILAGELSGYGEPGLVLTTVDPSDPSRDGYLSLSEIMALKFNAELVILSACNTGAPDGRPRAEWMSGLTRGFIAAGARNLLVTLWPIPSQSTVRLMTGMAHEKERAPDKGWSRALQRSVLNMIDNPFRPEDRHPASWAGFVMFGNG